jgi:GDPmannose 4,6-dehydratase
MAAERLNMKITWEGEGIDEKGYDQDGKLIVNVSSEYFRPTEVETLLGDSTLAKAELKWEPKISIDEMLDEMIEHDLQLAKYEIELGITSVKVHRKNS